MCSVRHDETTSDELTKVLSWCRTELGRDGDQWYRPVLYLRWKGNESGDLFGDRTGVAPAVAAPRAPAPAVTVVTAGRPPADAGPPAQPATPPPAPAEPGQELIVMPAGPAPDLGDRPLAAASFARALAAYSAWAGCTLLECTNDSAALCIGQGTDQEKTIVILRDDPHVELKLPGIHRFERVRDCPHPISTFLLERNARTRIGHWCIDEIAGDYWFALYHTIEIDLVDMPYLVQAIAAMQAEYDEVSRQIAELDAQIGLPARRED